MHQVEAHEMSQEAILPSRTKPPAMHVTLFTSTSEDNSSDGVTVAGTLLSKRFLFGPYGGNPTRTRTL